MSLFGFSGLRKSKASAGKAPTPSWRQSLISALKGYPVELFLFFSLYVSLLLYRFGVLETISFLVLSPLFISVAYSLNRLFPKKSLRFFYYLSAIPFFLLAPLGLWESWSDTSSFALTALLLCPLAIFLSGRRTANRALADDVLAHLYGGVLALGLSALIFALVMAINFSVLYIFGFSVEERIGVFAEYTAQTIFFLLCPLLFFALRPYFSVQQRPHNGLYDGVVNAILTPALFLYSLLLYLYFIKILVLWELPKGGVAYMVFGFTMAAMAVKALQYFVAKPRCAWFFRYFTWLSLPAQLLFWVAVLRRVGEFGFTESRVYLVVCGALMTLFLLSFLFRRMAHYYVFFAVSFGLFALMAFLPPLSAERLALRSQYATAQALSAHLSERSDLATYRRLLSALDYIESKDSSLLPTLPIRSKEELLLRAPEALGEQLGALEERQPARITLYGEKRAFHSREMAAYDQVLLPTAQASDRVYYTFDHEQLKVFVDDVPVWSCALPALLEAKLQAQGYSLEALPSQAVMQSLAAQLLEYKSDEAWFKLSSLSIKRVEGKARLEHLDLEFVLIQDAKKTP